ncbi:type VI secretion system Vgr family protein [Polyangium jinanense]|uniref:Type VI secretion system tip protein VgrG n=1 Tax=Polyangium jinanense TaxID=2829994 RepID=A0A9X3XCA6_9BACT|nr:type VI secretion system tip protein TssI/VgrG [Polyangium jinanense]MDC3961328.1 type VI secretion system tip protein VgrG [Polyangium jinanense]MDC3987707.1 type VI secretion system tip protein VgrG [Polyangium jinanense]
MSASRTSNLSVELASGDGFDVREFSVSEKISQLFEVRLVALSDNPNVDFEAIVGQPARFVMHGGHGEGGQPRIWTGICNELEQLGAEETGLSSYNISIVPTLWLATQRRNHRMFQQLSEPDIVVKMLSEWGIEPVLKIDKGAYKKRKYRVQYAETDYQFISRMLEDAGISFYFEPSEEGSKLVLSDAPQSNAARKPIAFRDNPTTADREHVTVVRMARKVRPGKYTMRDVDYRRPPSYNLAATASGAEIPLEDKLERFHYTPGAFLFGAEKGDDTPSADDKGKARTDEAEGAKLAQKRLEAKRGSGTAISFQTNVLDLGPGVVTSFLDHPRADLASDKQLLIIASHMAGTSTGEWTHHCEAKSTKIPHRPKAVMQRPKVNGVESATVVGPAGEEIHCDEFGRVRVHFHWDRESKMDDNSSCWIPVSQPWGGAGYGGMNLPRIGQEVLVDFLGGDPDRPVIVGRVFTNLQKVPWKLPDNKTQSGLRSNSTGGSGGYNEMMFEDALGKELVRFQAERDYNKLVKNDENTTVGNDRTKVIQRNENVTIGNDRTKTVKANETISIGKNLMKSVQASEREVTGMNRSVVVGVNRSTQVGGIDSTMVGGTHSVQIAPPGEGGGGATTAHVMEHDKITLGTPGGASITLEGNKVTITATTIEVAGSGVVSVTSSGGDVIIKGGPMVKINT